MHWLFHRTRWKTRWSSQTPIESAPSERGLTANASRESSVTLSLSQSAKDWAWPTRPPIAKNRLVRPMQKYIQNLIDAVERRREFLFETGPSSSVPSTERKGTAIASSCDHPRVSEWDASRKCTRLPEISHRVVANIWWLKEAGSRGPFISQAEVDYYFVSTSMSILSTMSFWMSFL